MKAAELLDGPECRLYTVYYPSGSIFSINGVFGGVLIGGEFSPSVRVSDDDICLLDPRGVITREGGIVYEPREKKRGLPLWAQEWLEENPGWPPLDLRINTRGAQ